jgi:hypothetical protein
MKGFQSNVALFDYRFAENITNELTIKLHMTWRKIDARWAKH